MKFLQLIKKGATAPTPEEGVLYYDKNTESTSVIIPNPIVSTTYEVKNISVTETQPMEASSTSATVTFTGVKTEAYKKGNTVVTETEESQTVEFVANETTETVTRNGSFEWNGESVAWSVNLKAKEDEPSVEYVDLGLPSGTLWATCNVGATSPEEYGMYFRWGETTGHYQTGRTVTGDPYKWVNTPFQTQDTTDYKSVKFTKYLGSTTSSYKDPSATDADALKKTVLDPEDDAAHVNMGGDWRMPTTADTVELVNNTTSEWVEDYQGTGVKGRLFTSKVNGQALFFPAAGGCDGGSVIYVGTYCLVWSSSLRTPRPCDAYALNFSSSYVGPQDSYYRSLGRSVRGVRV